MLLICYIQNILEKRKINQNLAVTLQNYLPEEKNITHFIQPF